MAAGRDVIFVFVGGGAGASLRFMAGKMLPGLASHGFPVATLAVNIAGSLVIGVLAGLVAGRMDAFPWLSPLAMTGFLGGLTTFSAFSLETVQLLGAGRTGAALLYMFLSLACSVSAAFAGLLIWREVLA